VVVWDPINEREIVLLTNLLHFGSTTIAAIYKDRWEIELFFESSTWCTPLDVMEFQGSVALNRPLVGSLDGSGLGRFPMKTPILLILGVRPDKRLRGYSMTFQQIQLSHGGETIPGVRGYHQARP
jgi:hypothetical protein